MNSTLNIILAIKLKFILIILSIGTSYLLEHRTNIQWVEEPETIGFIQNARYNEGILENQKKEGSNPVKETSAITTSLPVEPTPVSITTCGLSDLGLYIEL